jgi:hypothetical protein
MPRQLAAAQSRHLATCNIGASGVNCGPREVGGEPGVLLTSAHAFEDGCGVAYSRPAQPVLNTMSYEGGSKSGGA